MADDARGSVTARLSAMMFLQFFVWGAWYTTIGVFMANNGMETLTAWPYTVNPVAAIVAPFFLGLVADRFFATERVLGVLHLLGGALMLVAPSVAGNPTVFIGLLLAYNLCYMPTLGLSNSLAFSHIRDQEKEFPRVRVFGTVGWIVAGLFISYVLSRAIGAQAEATALPLYTTGIGSVLLGLYAFTLPHTPPQAKGQPADVRSILGLDALKTLGSRPFYVFVLSSFLICIPLAAYYSYAPLLLGAVGVQDVAATMTIGQVSEVLFMLLVPVFFARLGVKWMLLVGMLAWVVRYALFTFGAPEGVVWMVIAGIALHGICYDFFFVTGQIYVDKKSTPAIRGQAQGFLVLVTYGVGMLVGAQIAGALYNRFLDGGQTLSPEAWGAFWPYPAAFAAAVALFFALAFRDAVPTDAARPAASDDRPSAAAGRTCPSGCAAAA